MTQRIVSALVLTLVLLGPVVASHISVGQAVDSPSLPFDNSPSAGILGAEYLGRSVVLAVLQGGQKLVTTAILAGTLSTVFGVAIGCLGALRPQIGFLVDALADVTILIPAVIVLLLASVLYPNAGLWMLIAIVAILGTPYAARVIAAASYPVARSGFVQAAFSTGASLPSIILLDIMPNISEVIRSVWGLRIIEALYLLAVASFLGAGSGLGEFAWSAMVRDNASGIALNPFAVLAPAVALAGTSIAVVTLLKSTKGPAR